MKTASLILLFLMPISCTRTTPPLSADEQAVKDVVNLFFDSLAKQDTLLMKKAVFPEGQVWTISNFSTPSRYGTRFLTADLNNFNPGEQLLETPLSFDIKVDNGIAMAWVPYEFHLNNEFSHCGVDIFTLLKDQGAWKITTISYSLEREGCSETDK